MEQRDLKTERILEIFYHAMRGESLSAAALAEEYHVSGRSITRDLNDLKVFLAEHREEMGHLELLYSGSDHCYRLSGNNFISNKELFALTKIIVGTKAFNNQELLQLIDKLKTHTTERDRKTLENLLQKELYHYTSIKFDCQSILDNLWVISQCIENRQSITVSYYRMDRVRVSHRLKPVAIMFAEYYFYLLAFRDGEDEATPYYFRIDRIVDIVRHRGQFTLTKKQKVDEGLLRQRSQFMWPGKLRQIEFEFTGPSVQAVLDRLPTAKIVSVQGNKYTIRAQVYGEGIKMYLLSQGSWVRVIAPTEFVQEMALEVKRMQNNYKED